MYVATHLDEYRKPGLGFWKAFENSRKHQGEAVDYESSFYVGDCAGRLFNPTRKQPDPTDTDLKFALNIGIKFFTPEEFFSNKHEQDKVKLGRKIVLPDLSNYLATIQRMKAESTNH